MSIATELTRLNTNKEALTTAKTAIASAITTKGGTVTSGDGFEDFATDIASIPSGGGEDVSGETVNEYVASYLESAFEAYENNPERTVSIVTSYNQHIQDVRKDHPVSIKVNADSDGFVRDNNTGGTYFAEVTNGTLNLFNISKNGGQYIIDNGTSVEKAGHVSTLSSLRMIFAPSIFNVRDMGGWNCDGGTVAYGKAFRGSDLNNETRGVISDADKAMLTNFLGIKSEIDFSEDGTESALGANVLYKASYVSVYYKPQIDLDGTVYQTTKNALLRLFDDAKNNRPSYFHCSVGCDRAGTLAVIIGGILGMSEVEIDINHELSSFTWDTKYSKMLTRQRTDNNYKELISYIKSLTSTVPTSPDYFRDGCIAWCVLAGINIDDINEFRQNMIDGNPETVTAHIKEPEEPITVIYQKSGTFTFQTKGQSGYTETVSRPVGKRLFAKWDSLEYSGEDASTEKVGYVIEAAQSVSRVENYLDYSNEVEMLDHYNPGHNIGENTSGKLTVKLQASSSTTAKLPVTYTVTNFRVYYYSEGESND